MYKRIATLLILISISFYFSGCTKIYHSVDMMITKNGYAVKKYDNGNIYKGHFKRDVLYGSGEFIWADGTIHKGEFKYGDFHGYGVRTWKDGREFAVEWYRDSPRGKGRFKDKNGVTYDGYWKSADTEWVLDTSKDMTARKDGRTVYGKFHGSIANGFKLKGKYKLTFHQPWTTTINNKKITFNSGTKYYGEVDKNLEPKGYGRLDEVGNLVYYEGKWPSVASNDLRKQFTKKYKKQELTRNQKCKTNHGNHWIYVSSTCKNFKAHGYGKAIRYFKSKKYVLEGKFTNGNLVNGQISEDNEKLYQGGFYTNSNGKFSRHGKGLCYKNGRKEYCEYNKGQRIDETYVLRKKEQKIQEELAREEKKIKDEQVKMKREIARQERRIRDADRRARDRELELEEELEAQEYRNRTPQTSAWASGIMSGLKKVQQENFANRSGHDMINDSVRDTQRQVAKIQRQRAQEKKEQERELRKQRERYALRESQLKKENAYKVRQLKEKRERLQRDLARQKELQRKKQQEVQRKQVIQRENCTGRFESIGKAPKGQCGYVYTDYTRNVHIDYDDYNAPLLNSHEKGAKDTLKGQLRRAAEKICKAEEYDFIVNEYTFEHRQFDWKTKECKDKKLMGGTKLYKCKGSASFLCGGRDK